MSAPVASKTLKSTAEAWAAIMSRKRLEQVIVSGIGDTASLSFKQLNAAIYCLASFWKLRNLKAGETVVLISASDPWYAAIETSIQFVGGVSLTLDPRMPENALREIIREVGARFYYVSDYKIYTQFRHWLDPLTNMYQLVCNTDRGDKLQETDRLSTLDSAFFVGKNWWREHQEELLASRDGLRSSMPSIKWIETRDNHYVVKELLQQERMAWMDALAPPKRLWPADAKVLTVAQEHQLWAVGVGIFLPLVAARKLLLCPPHTASVLQALKRDEIQVLVAPQKWLLQFRDELKKEFQREHPMRRRSTDGAFKNDQKIRLALRKGSSPGFGAKAKKWPNNRWIFKPMKKKYLPKLELILTHPGADTEALIQFFEPLQVHLRVDSGSDFLAEIAGRKLNAKSGPESELERVSPAEAQPG